MYFRTPSIARMVHQRAGRRVARRAASPRAYGLIDRGIASGEFYECDSHVVALGASGMTPGRLPLAAAERAPGDQEIAAEFSDRCCAG